jgi:hypothetical protein
MRNCSDIFLSNHVKDPPPLHKTGKWSLMLRLENCQHFDRSSRLLVLFLKNNGIAL